MADVPDLPAELAADSPRIEEAYDTSTEFFGSYVDRVESRLGAGAADHVRELDLAVRREAPDTVGLRVALKIIESRLSIRSIDEPLTVTLINPVYKETTRLLPRDEHLHGEDSIRYKARALDRISMLNPDIRTRLMVIDDGCPDGSGEMAARILGDLDGWQDRHEVLFLDDAIRNGHPDVPPGLTGKDGARRSVKGGAVLFGMRRALRLDVSGRHVVVDNDADLSVLPDQLGLLLSGVVSDGCGVVAGSRREPESVALIGPSRDARGSLFIAIWQHLLPELATHVVDTNRAFKAFDSSALSRIVDDVEIYTFPYQIEILQAAISRGIPVCRRAIAYVDSEAASTQQGEAITETYLEQIDHIIDIARRYRTINTDDRLIEFFDGVDDTTWLEMEQDPPRELLDILGVS